MPHRSSSFYFSLMLLDQRGNMRHRNEHHHLGHSRKVWLHLKWRSLFLHPSLLLLVILNTDQLNILEYDMYASNALSYRICNKCSHFSFFITRPPSLVLSAFEWLDWNLLQVLVYHPINNLNNGFYRVRIHVLVNYYYY